MSARKEAKEEKRAACSTAEPADRCNAGQSRSVKAGRNLPAAIGVVLVSACYWCWGLISTGFVAIATGAAQRWAPGRLGTCSTPAAATASRIPAGCPVWRNYGGVFPVPVLPGWASPWR